MWTSEQIKHHREAAKKIKKIVDLSFEYIRQNKDNITEKEVQAFIYQKIKERELLIDKTPVIVAFGESSADPHYHPREMSNRKLKKNRLIMIDVWARIDKKSAPFADITWMGFYGDNMSQKIQKVFALVIGARDEGMKFIKDGLKNKSASRRIPLGKEVDKIVRNYIHHHGYGERFIHGTGHSLGFHGPHGNRSRISKKGHQALIKNVAYTIEPGVYLEKEFGVRSEIDFYISTDFKFILTTDLQKKMIKI